MSVRLVQAMGAAGHGGAETNFVNVAEALGKAGLEQRLVTRYNALRSGELARAGLAPRHLPFGGPLDLYTPFALKREARRFAPDFVVTWMKRASSLAPRGPWLNIGRMGAYYDLKYYHRCDHIIGVTPDIVAYMVREGWPEDRAHCVSNFASFASAPPVSRAELLTPDDAPLVLALGRLHRIKGMDLLVKAIAQVDGVYLWLAGEGGERPALEQLVREAGIADRVRFLGWRADREALLAAADICAIPSRSEGFGTVMVEAWAAGVPLIATMSQGPGAYIADGEDGMLVPLEDWQALAAGLDRLVREPKLREALADRGRARYESEFTEAAAVRNWCALFEELQPELKQKRGNP